MLASLPGMHVAVHARVIWFLDLAISCMCFIALEVVLVEKIKLCWLSLDCRLRFVVVLLDTISHSL
jgi:hypothetical protein